MLPGDSTPNDASHSSERQEPLPKPLVPVLAPSSSVRAEFVSPPHKSAAPDAMGMLNALRRRWFLGVTLGVVIAGLAAGGTWLFMPKAKNSAHTWITVNPSSTMQVGEPDFISFKGSQAALVRSRVVLNRAMRAHPNMQHMACLQLEGADPLEVLATLLVVDFKVSPTTMQIMLVGDNESELKEIVEAVADAYIVETESQAPKLKEFEERRIRAKSNLLSRQEELSRRMKFANSGDPLNVLSQRVYVQNRIILVQNQLMQHESKIRELSAMLQVEQGSEQGFRELPVLSARAFGLLASPTGQAPLLASPLILTCAESVEALQTAEESVKQNMRADPGLNALFERKAKLEEKWRSTVGAFENPQGHPEVKAAREALDRIEDQIHDRRMDWMKQDIASLVSRIKFEKSIEQLAKNAEGQLTKQLDDLGAGAGKNMDFAEERLNVANAEEAFKKADAELEWHKLYTSFQQRIRIMESENGVVVHGNDLKRRSFATAGAGIGAFFLLLFGVAFMEFRTHKIQSVDDVTLGTGLRIVGTLPAPSRARRLTGPNANNAYWQNMMTESVDAIRTMILHAAQRENIRVIMVTSAVGGEGKTSLSSHLAASLARAGRNTLILDGDLRKPSAHRMFDVEPGPGFGEVLRGELDLAGAIYSTAAGNLSVIPAGRCDAAALQVLAQGGANGLFEELRKTYDFVVVDSAPVLPVADSLLLGQHVDAVVFSILREVSRMPRVYAAYQRLSMLGIRMLGAVVNGTHESSYGPCYYYDSAEV